jgi:N-glycosylase/DNA lyase
MAVFYILDNEKLVARAIPDADDTVLPGVRWGRPDILFTPAYWMTQYWMHFDGIPEPRHRLGETLEEEIVACLLGGYGIPAETGIAAFQHLKRAGIFHSSETSPSEIATLLRTPLTVDGRAVVYRFWAQKARYIAAALNQVNELNEPQTPISLRDRLMEFPGVGPKTASWIVRNWSGSDEVAILDIHIVRAGLLMNLFSQTDHVERNYREMEQRFLKFSAALNVATSHLDALIWHKMRSTPQIVSICLDRTRSKEGSIRRDRNRVIRRLTDRQSKPTQLRMY